MVLDRSEPAEENSYQCRHAAILLNSYRSLLNKDLLPSGPDKRVLAKRLYEADFVVVAHDTQDDPIFFYANLAAQRLFAMDWAEFTRLPSRLSAEPVNRAERQKLMEKVASRGFIDDYRGARIAKDGRRFTIEGATVWNLFTEEAQAFGQAAVFSDWRFL